MTSANISQAAEALGTQFGTIIAAQLTLQISLLSRLSEELNRNYEGVLQEVLASLRT